MPVRYFAYQAQTGRNMDMHLLQRAAATDILQGVGIQHSLCEQVSL
uniref:Uncharacterized protein n=1 Tax=Rheinheimera sp. BAL341 TaxID=1708203 RepID=A0A486XVX7_9GAMM